ncbi:MAG: 1-acyl-sn-glycerol-3-phosphate acyltransferase [Candidatus Aminicenantes bacterium]|nr:1-acyl-sn-glycerol-3-phosphate acyltransferase [Candidatus Aminicenantes bacterium]
MTRALDVIRSVLLWTAAFPIFILACLSILAVALVYRGPGLERVIKFGCRAVLFAAGVRIRLHGREHFEPGRRYLMMMNHVNLLDPLVFYARFPGFARTVEEECHFRWPVYGWMIRRIGQIPINRVNPRKAAASLARAGEFIRARSEFSFIVFPEGTRTPDGKLGPFKRGGFLLAREAGLDILPIIQVGSYRIMRKGSRLLRPGRVDLFIEPAVALTGSSREDTADWMARVRRVFEDKAEGSGLAL